MENKCRICLNLIKVIDEKGRVRYQCPFNLEIEYLGAICDEPLNKSCGKFVKKIVEEK